MKSIKEKAEEYATENINSMGYKSQEHFDGFKAGAYYVLEQIDKGFPSEDNRNLNDYGNALVWRLKDVIKQLKK